MTTFLKMAWTVTLLFILPNLFYGQTPNLGTTASFALFTGTGAFNGDAASTVTGDIGTNTGAHTFTGTLNGAAHWGDAIAVQAASDVGVAFGSFPAGGIVQDVGLGGESLMPGIYAIGAAATIDGVLTLNGNNDPNAVFIIKIDGALAMSGNSSVSLINQANLCNVYFRINGAFSMGVNSSFSGTVVASGAINLGSGAIISGRVLSTAGAIGMNSNTVTLSGVPSKSTVTAGGATTFCAGGSVMLSGNNNLGTWSNGSMATSITVSASGSFFITNTNSCGSATSNIIVVTVNEVPGCTITGDNSICQGQSTQLCAPAGASGYLWSTGATSSCITVSAAGTYSVTVTDDGCSNVCSRTVTVSTLPACTITGDASLCQGQTGQLCVPAGATGYLWSTGATTNCITVGSIGTYSVTVTNADGCTSTCSQSVTIDPLPACTITGNDAFCTGQTNQLCVPSGAASYLWSTGATTNCINVNTGGTFSVTVTNASGCTSVCSKTVTLDLAPVASVISAKGPLVFCEPNSVILSGNNGGTWSTGATTPTITVNTSGDYFVTNSNTCGMVTSNHIVVTVNPLPESSVITADGAVIFCVGDSVILSGNDGGGTWNTGATTPSITVKTIGDYLVRDTNACGTVISNHIFVQVDTLLIVSILIADGDTIFCEGDSVILSGNDGGLWSNGATTPTITVKTSGDYFVTTSNSCDTFISNHFLVTVIPFPVPAVISADGPTSICVGDSVILTGNNGGIWNTGQTTTSITVKTSGEFYVINQNICDTVTSNHIVVTVVELPMDNAGVDDTICKGQSITLGGPATPGHTYNWSPSGGLSSTTISNPVTTTPVTKKYTLIETITGLGCQATSMVTITVSPYPPCVIKGNPKICEGQSTSLCAPAGPYTYLWSNGDTSRCIEVDVLGRYTVTVTNAMGCSSICGQTVVQGEGPCEITGKSDIYAGNTTVLCATGGYASYLWSTGATTPCITVSAAGTYSVTLTTSNGCVSVCSKTVNVIPVLCVIEIDTICKTLYTLCATEVPGNTYYWTSGGQTTRCVTVDCSGTYGVRVTNSRKSNTCSVYINAKVWGPRAQNTWSINGNLTPSQGQISTLCAPFGFSEYQWSNGAKTQCINVNASGFYGVNFSYKTGCSGSAGATVNYSSSRRASREEIAPPVVLSGNLEVTAYPNPFKQSAVFEVQNNESDARVTIELVDLTGMKVARVFDADVVRGTRYTTVFDAGLLVDGIYFYRYVSGDQVITRKLILMK